MNTAYTYLSHIRQTLVRRVLLHLMTGILTASLCCLLSFLLFSHWHSGVIWRISAPSGSRLISAALTQTPALLLLLIRYLGTFTVFSRWISGLSAAVRGAGIGCACAFLRLGLLTGIPPAFLYGSAVTLFLHLLLCAMCDVYSDCFLTLTGIRERRLRSSLLPEYSVWFGVLGGSILLLQIISIVLIS